MVRPVWCVVAAVLVLALCVSSVEASVSRRGGSASTVLASLKTTIESAGCAAKSGICGEKSQCHNFYVSGLCPGSATVVCCIATAATKDSTPGIAPPVAPAAPAAVATTSRGQAVRGAPLYYGGNSTPFPQLGQPTAKWLVGFGGAMSPNWDSNNLGTMVLYNIPGRDAGQYSAGGSAGESAYLQWVQMVANRIGSARTAVILEPDALAQSAPGQASASLRTARVRMLKAAIVILKANPNTAVYVDCGHANWLSASTAAQALLQVGMDLADGFSINVSNFVGTAASLAYGKQVSALATTKGKSAPHFVIDTSRNGAASTASGWCNPSQAGLGRSPTTTTGEPLLDAYLWIKRPGESDGNCNGAPNAGVFDNTLAQRLIANAAGR